MSLEPSAAERRARKIGALPPLQTEKERHMILAVYEAAEALSRATGITHEVDHIIPLKGECPYTLDPVVCGLHVAGNLRAIPASLNRMRANQYCGAGPFVLRSRAATNDDDDFPW